MNSIGNNHTSFNINSGIRLSGVVHSDFSNKNKSAISHGSKSVRAGGENETVISHGAKSVKASGNKEVAGGNLTAGLMRNKADRVDLSREGRELARKLREDKIDELKEKTSEARSGLERVDELNKKLREGEALSDEDREFINDELKKLSAQNYVDKRYHVFTRDDYEQAISTLQENMKQRIRLYSDMQRELEAQKDDDYAAKTAQMLAKAEDEQGREKRIVEILKDTLSEDDEDETEEKEVNETATGEKAETTEGGVIEFENEEHAAKTQEEIQKFRAIDLIDSNKEQLDKMQLQSGAESKEARELDAKMDEELIRSYDLLSNDELSEEEKLDEFNKSYAYMNNLLHDKCIETVKSKLDFDSWLVGKIEFNAHNNIHEVTDDGNIINAMGGLDMVLDFLTDANAY